MRYTFGQTKEKVDERPNTKTETKGSGTVFTGADLDRAIYEMTSVKSREELERVWAKHPAMQNNNEFRNITMEMGRSYPPKQ